MLDPKIEFHNHKINDKYSLFANKLLKYYRKILKIRNKIFECEHCKNIVFKTQKEWLGNEHRTLDHFYTEQDIRDNNFYLSIVIPNYSNKIEEQKMKIEKGSLILSYLPKDELCWKCQKRLDKISIIYEMYLKTRELYIIAIRSNTNTKKIK